MKNVFCLFAMLVMLTACKDVDNDLPTPVAPVAFTVAADSIKLNPYGYSPLAALVSFSTPATGKSFVRVRGKHGSITTVEHVFNDTGTSHSVPVLGLYPNYANTVDIGVLSASGDTLAISTMTIQTGDLPPNMPTSITAAPFDEARVAPGLVLVSSLSNMNTDSPSTPYFMDAYGDIRWVLDFRTNESLKTLNYSDGIDRLRNGNFFFGDDNPGTPKLYEVNALGQVINSWSMPGYLFHHNVVEKPNGNLLLTASKPGSTNLTGEGTIEDYVIEIDRKSGNIATEWDLKQSLDEQRTALFGSTIPTASDWFHGNSVDYDSTDNTIVVSGRHQGVVKLDYQNKVKWILAAHKGWMVNRRGEDLNPFLLQPLDASGRPITDQAVIDGSKVTADFEWNWYQHSNIFLPNGDLMLFDNGEIREYNTEADRYSRAVAYKIDPTKMTVQQTWTYGKERGLSTFSTIISSVQFLPASQHVLFAPGYQVTNATGVGGKIVEVDAATKQIVSEISVSSASGWAFHRAKKMSLYP